jgi:hypothetical protein
MTKKQELIDYVIGNEFITKPSLQEKFTYLLDEALTEQLILSGVSKSLVADIRNKLSSPENLCAMLKDREVEPFIGNDERNQMIDAEIKQTLKSIEYLSNL